MRWTELRPVYQFNVRAFLRLISQYSVVKLNPAFAEGVPDRNRDLFNQLLFSYKVNPQTALFLGYSDDRTNNGFDINEELVVTDGLTQTGRSFFFKIGYAWVPR